jgi:threonine/homoserine/homoserine lactone efflux protein
MQHVSAVLLDIGILWSAAVMAPGPNFVITTRAAMLSGRNAGLRTAFGVACGAMVWGAAGFFGIQCLFSLAPWLYLGLKLGGSAYLIALGLGFLRAGTRNDPMQPLPSPPSDGTAAWRALLVSVANPQSALSTASLFAATLPDQPPLWLGIAAVALMSAIALLWYGVVACVLTVPLAAMAFRRARHWIDRLAGLTFVGLGLRLALER